MELPTTNKNSIQGNLKRVTRKFTNCLRCNNPLSGRQEKFCCDSCRWAYHNKARLNAEKELLELLDRLWKKYRIGAGG